MHLQVDQGITKIGDTKGPTFLAFSNTEQHVIIIPATTKREIITWLRAKQKFKPAAYYQMFAACLFLLLKNHIAKATAIVIDNEYKGHESEIKGLLLGYIQRLTKLDAQQVKDKLAIGSLPKRNRADRLIHQVHTQPRSKRKATFVHTHQLKAML